MSGDRRLPIDPQTHWPNLLAPLHSLADQLRDLDLPCRDYFLGADIDLASITIAVVISMLPPIALLDYSYYGLSTDFLWTSVFEGCLAIFSLAIILLIRRQRETRTYERAIVLWSAVIALVFLVVDYVEPTRLAENTLFSILILFAMYIALPNRFVLILAPAVGLTLGGLIALATLASPVRFQDRYVFGLTLVMLNVAGVIVVARSNRFKRREYYAQRNEHVARQLYESLAQTDALTGLLNRRSFLEHAQQALNRFQRYHSVFSLIIFDLDFFKRVNDTYGHLAGDEALRRFAAVLQAEKRATDEAGRLGGEEFGLLLVETNQATALAAAARLQQAVRGLRLTPLAFQISFSAGVTEAQPDDRTLDDLIRRADGALYQAKALGRDRVEAD